MDIIFITGFNKWRFALLEDTQGSSAKISLDHGRIPFILEKKASPGGLWNAFDGQIRILNS